MDGNEGRNPRRPVMMREWLDQTELSLRLDAQRAGLFDHPTLTGNGREFLIHRVIGSMLPPMIHIGAGQIIDSHDRRSRQVDAVVYDPRLPVLRGDGGASLFFIEGVIAAIEIKSRLTSEHLAQALENGHSILSLEPCLTSTTPLDQYGLQLIRTRGFSEEEAEDYVRYQLRPKTYIWAYASDLSAETIGRQVNEWYESHPRPRTPYNPLLPSLIASGNAVGIQSDDWLCLDAGTAQADVARQHGTHARPLMGFWPTRRQFGWLILRLVHDIRTRIPSIHGATRSQFALDRYFPIHDYSDEDIYTQTGHFIFWH